MSDQAFEAPDLEYLNEQLHQYEFLGFIAQGGMGAVYKARQLSLDRDVAIKVLPKELGEDDEFRKSFAKEAKAMAKLNHPNLISVYDSGDVDGMPYIVMEYIEGSSLHDSIWGQEVEASQAVTIIKAICDGLADAHEHGIIHRDIKPANILLNTKAIPKIGDFGLAHPTDSDEQGLVMGTPGYTAPEVFTDASQAGTLADIYSVGMILHQMLTGIDPAGTQGPPSEASGNIRLDAIWRKATQPHPGSRYGSATQMATELQKWLDSKTGSLVTGGTSTGGALTINPQTGPVSTPGPNSAPVSLPAANQGGGFGMMIKVASIGVLAAAAWFTYGLLQDNKDAINKKIAEVNNLEEPSTPALPGNEVDTSAPAPTPIPAEVVGNPNPTPNSSPEPPVPSPQPVIPDPVEVATNPPNNSTEEPIGVPDPPTPVVPDPVVEVTPEPKEELPPGDPELQEKAIALILNARAKRDQLLEKNAKSFQFSLKPAVRSASKSEASFIEGFIEACDGGWLPEPDQVPELSRVVSIKYEAAHRDQLSILEKHQSELTSIRDHYISILKKSADDSSDDELKAKLVAQANRAAGLEPWIAMLAPEPEREPIIIKPGAGGGFVGTWHIVSDKVNQWETKADGSITVIGPGWEGSWKILADGTLEVTFGGKKPYSLTRDGTGWSGKTGFGRPIRITPLNTAAADLGVRGGGDIAKKFVGRWDSHTGPVTKWVAERNGVLTILGDNLKPKSWSGKWQELANGVIWVQITDKEPYEIVPDGDGWKSNNQRAIVLKPADW